MEKTVDYDDCTIGGYLCKNYPNTGIEITEKNVTCWWCSKAKNKAALTIKNRYVAGDTTKQERIELYIERKRIEAEEREKAKK